MPQFQHTITVTRPSAGGGGATDPTTGEYTPPAPDGTTTLYAGPGLYLDEGVAVGYQPGTQIPVEDTGNARAYLPRGTVGRLEANGAGVEANDTVTIEFSDGAPAVDASVVRAVRYKDVLYLRRA